MPLGEAEQGQLDADGGREEQGGVAVKTVLGKRSGVSPSPPPPGGTVVDDEAEAGKSMQIRGGETGRCRGRKTRAMGVTESEKRRYPCPRERGSVPSTATFPAEESVVVYGDGRIH